MAMENLLAAAKLTRMPFRIVPPSDMDNLIWAGDRDVLESLLTAARSPRPDHLDTSELVLIYGEYGSGKTHTMKWLAKTLREEQQLVVYLPRMTVVERPTWSDLVREMFANQFSRDDIVTRLQPIRQHVLNNSRALAETELGAKASAYPDMLRNTEAEKKEQIFHEVLPDCPGFVRFIMDLSDPSDTKRMQTLWGFLSTKMTAAQASAVATPYGIPPAGMTSDHDAGLLFHYFCRVITHSTANGPGSDAVYIFIDETEDLIDIRVDSRRSLMQGLRELSNSVTEHTFVALSATVSDAAELYGVFEEPIMQRLSRRPFPIPQLSPESARQFVMDELEQHRPTDFNSPLEWPFSSDGLDAFVHNMPPPTTLRKINVSAQRLLFDKYASKVLRGDVVDASDVADFVDWGGG